MKILFHPINNQDGSMILIAMMLIVMLTIMGITSTTTSVVENRVAVNEQLHKMAFYNADLGIYSTAGIISAAIDREKFDLDELSDENLAFEFIDEQGGFYEQIFPEDIEDYDGGFADIEIASLDNGGVRTDVEYLGRTVDGASGVGGFADGTEYSGFEGEEIRFFYDITSRGTSHRNSVSIISARYRKVLQDDEG